MKKQIDSEPMWPVYFRNEITGEIKILNQKEYMGFLYWSEHNPDSKPWVWMSEEEYRKHHIAKRKTKGEL